MIKTEMLNCIDEIDITIMESKLQVMDNLLDEANKIKTIMEYGDCYYMEAASDTKEKKKENIIVSLALAIPRLIVKICTAIKRKFFEAKKAKEKNETPQRKKIDLDTVERCYDLASRAQNDFPAVFAAGGAIIVAGTAAAKAKIKDIKEKRAQAAVARAEAIAQRQNDKTTFLDSQAKMKESIKDGSCVSAKCDEKGNITFLFCSSLQAMDKMIDSYIEAVTRELNSLVKNSGNMKKAVLKQEYDNIAFHAKYSTAMTHLCTMYAGGSEYAPDEFNKMIEKLIDKISKEKFYEDHFKVITDYVDAGFESIKKAKLGKDDNENEDPSKLAKEYAEKICSEIAFQYQALGNWLIETYKQSEERYNELIKIAEEAKKKYEAEQAKSKPTDSDNKQDDNDKNATPANSSNEKVNE